MLVQRCQDTMALSEKAAAGVAFLSVLIFLVYQDNSNARPAG